jgi:hypothetical protein
MSDPAPQRRRPDLSPAGLGRGTADRFLWLLGYRQMPPSARHSFRIDFQFLVLIIMIAAAIRHPITQAIAEKAMQAPPMLVAALFTAMVAGNIASLFWAWLAGGRNVVRFMLVPSTLAGIFALGLGFVPTTRPWVFFALVAMVCLCLTGVVTLRTVAWRSNYARHGVGRIVSRLTMLEWLLATALIWGFGLLQDQWEQSYRLFFPAGGLLAIVGGLRYQRLTLRDSDDSGESAARMSLLTGLRILRNDRPYRRYIGLQMIFGGSTMMTEAILVTLLKENFQSSYNEIAVYMSIVPVAAIALFVPVAGRLLDRSSPMLVRVWGAGAWAVSRALLLIAAWLGSLPLLICSRVFSGIGIAFGQVAWHVGHVHFAPRELVGHYMGLHVTATGVRGLIAPFLGMALFAGVTLPGWMGGGHWEGIGAWVFAIAMAGQLFGCVGFWRMHRHYRRFSPVGPESTV